MGPKRKASEIENMSDELPKRDRDYSETVFIMSPNETPHSKSLTVHKYLLCQKSKYFTEVFASDWRPAISCDIEEFEPFQSEVYLDWIYRDHVLISIESINHVDFQHRFHADIWLMGFYFQDLEFCNEVMDLHLGFAKRKGPPSPTVCHYIWDQTEKGSSFRKAVVDLIIWDHMPQRFSQQPISYSGEIVYEIASRLMANQMTVTKETRAGNRPAARKQEYHEE